MHQQLKLLLALPQRVLGGLAFGQIAGDLGEAEQLTGRIEDRIDHDIGPEPCAVLADAPAFGLEFALPLRSLQGASRQAGGAVFLAVEAGEMLADNLVGAVTLEALRAGIPAGHDAGRIEHIDGVIGNRFDQKPVAAVLA